MITELNERSEAVLRYIVDNYLQTGAPVGSKIIADCLPDSISSATIRNVMSDLEKSGLLYAPHTSAGRLPTQQGLRFYVDGLMEVGDLSNEEQRRIEQQCQSAGYSPGNIMEQATTMLSGLSGAAGMVVAPKTEKPIKQIQFVKLNQRKLLVILVMENGLVENRLMETQEDLPDSALIEASNYLNAQLIGKTLAQTHEVILEDIASHQTQLDELTEDLVKRGIAIGNDNSREGHLIIRGQSHLLDDVKAIEDLEQARRLMASLEEQETISHLLQSAQNAEGVQIYIGTENQMFDHSGWSMVISPYKNQQRSIIGAIGVIGPTRLNYRKIIPLLDYTSKVMEKIMS